MELFTEEIVDLNLDIMPTRKQLTMDQKIAKIQKFYADRGIKGHNNEVVGEVQQLVFIFSKGKIEIVEERETDFKMCFGERRKSQCEVLLYHSEEQLDDFLKYLGTINRKNWSKEQKAEQIVTVMKRHQEYLLLLFSKECIQQLMSSLDVVSTDDILLSNNAVMELCNWGILDMDIRKKKGKTMAYLSFSEEAKGYVQSLRKADLAIEYKKQKELTEPLMAIVRSYGILDFDTLYDKYNTIMDGKVSMQTMCRILYLYGTFHRRILTGSDDSGKTRFAIVHGIDIEAALRRRALFGSELKLRNINKRKINAWKKGLVGYEKGFKLLEETLPEQIVWNIYIKLLQGDSAEQVISYVKAINYGAGRTGSESLKEDVKACVDECIRNLSACVYIYPLSMYSRTEIADKEGKKVEDIAVEIVDEQ